MGVRDLRLNIVETLQVVRSNKFGSTCDPPPQKNLILLRCD